VLFVGFRSFRDPKHRITEDADYADKALSGLRGFSGVSGATDVRS